MNETIEKFGIYFDEMGLSKTYGRLFGIFIMTTEPLSMAQLVEQLKISKSTASTELRRLVSMGVIEKVLLPRARSDYYQLKPNFWVMNLTQKILDIKKLRTIVEELPQNVVKKIKHLEEMGNYCIFMEKELEQLIKKYASFSEKKKITFGSYIERGNGNKIFLVEWSMIPALSDEFANKMASVSDLGMECFREIELDFLAFSPQALEEDKNLFPLKGLQGEALEQAINARLFSIFATRLWDLSEQWRSLMADAYYYFVTIREESSNKIQGFITFFSGGGITKDEYKITILAVDKTSRRGGLAGLLVGALKKIEVPYKKLLVCTRPSNIVAINAYKKWGFIADQEAMNNPPSHFY